MNFFHRYLSELQEIQARLPLDRIEEICRVIHRAYQNDRTVFLFGNGGSAALASHLACDLGKGVHWPAKCGADGGPVKPLKVLSVTDNVPMITAWANDAAYDEIFARQIENFIQPGDVAFAISGSGNSPNVLKALALAREKGAVTVGLTGFQGGKMLALLDHGIVVPSHSMQQIEDMHLVLAHMIFLSVCQRIADGADAGVGEERSRVFQRVP
jgi:D-sedoheptulose 7-phosphate isomerase